jgi:hypothetical protein
MFYINVRTVRRNVIVTGQYYCSSLIYGTDFFIVVIVQCSAHLLDILGALTFNIRNKFKKSTNGIKNERIR